jgi:hypothetical protein
MDLAEEDPESFGVSAATSLSDSMYQESESIIPLRLNGIRAVDFVDDPAATRGGLFDMTTPHGLPALATWIVTTHFADREPAEIVERMCSFLSKHYGRNVMNEVLAGNQAGQIQNPAPAPVAPAGLSLDAAKPFIEAFGDRGAKWFLEGRSMEDCFAEVSKDLMEVNKNLLGQIQDLQTRLEAAIKAAAGEESALSSEPKVEIPAEKQKAIKLASDLKAQGASEKSARWAGAFSN